MKLLGHDGIPKKTISLIQCSYQGMSCRVVHGGQLSDHFEVTTGEHQGCLLLLFLFTLVVGWIMRTSTEDKEMAFSEHCGHSLMTLHSCPTANNQTLLSHSHTQMQDKTTCLESTSARMGFDINNGKTKITRMQHASNSPVTVAGQPLEEVNPFTYLGNMVDTQGRTDTDVSARIGKV